MLSQMILTITNIFTTPDQLVTVNSINILIEIIIFTPKLNKGFMKLFIDKCLVVVIQLIGTSLLCYNNICIANLWDPALTFSIFKCFSWHFFTLFYRTVFNVLFKNISSSSSFWTHMIISNWLSRIIKSTQ